MQTERKGDMDPKNRLRIIRDAEGDIIVQILQFGPQGSVASADVEFCTVPRGGGRSPHTFDALLELIEAMDKDNEKGKYLTIAYDPAWPNDPE